MHRQRNVLPIVNLTYSQVRFAATAAKLKADDGPSTASSDWSLAQSSSTGQAQNFPAGSKWSLPRAPPNSSTGRPTPTKWALPTAPGSTSRQQKPVDTSYNGTAAPIGTNPSKWRINTPSKSSNNRGTTLTPDLRKWGIKPDATRTGIPYQSQTQQQPDSSQRSHSVPRLTADSSTSPTSRANPLPPASNVQRADPRLQRDVAPHHLPRNNHAQTSFSDRPRSSSFGLRGVDPRPPSTTFQRDGQQADSPHTRQPQSTRSGFNSTSPSSSSDAAYRSSSDTHEERLDDSWLRNQPGDMLDGLEEVRGGGRSRQNFKGRGSLVAKLQDGSYDSSQHGAHDTHTKTDTTPKIKKRKTFQEKQVRADVYIPSTVSVGTLARLLNVRLERLQRKMDQAGMRDETSYDYVLTSDYAVLLAEEFGRNPIVNDEAAFDIYPPPVHPNPSTLPSRPPVVTIMGHVDHGKTTLLDTLRSSAVAKGEAGGITQHIGAFSVPVPAGSSPGGPRTITFLDTPGHAAFSAMRARGAGVTDIIVLVVAADDGVMPQTREVINLIKQDKGNVGVVVAINKVDKPGVVVDDVQKALMAEDIQLEVFGGDIPSVEVSGLTGKGLPELVETLSAMAEVQDLRAEHDGPAYGYVLESRVHKGLGSVATILVLRGCLKPGTHILSGTSHGKVRVMNDSTGAPVKAAYPGMAVTVSGWKTIPDAGSEVLQAPESDIKKALANRIRQSAIEASLSDVEAINASRRLERERRELDDEEVKMLEQEAKGPKELRLVVKGDVSGSVEAVVGALQGIGNAEAVTKVISSGVGDVTESDVMMAKTAAATVIAFSVNVPRTIQTMAANEQVPIYSSDIIYRLVEEVTQRVVKLLPSIVEKRVTGEATVLQIFDISVRSNVTKQVAGCRATNGLLDKSKQARVMRKGQIIFEGTLDTMRYMKDDVTQVRKGSECGLSLHGFSDLRENDVIQFYDMEEKPGVLD